MEKEEGKFQKTWELEKGRKGKVKRRKRE